MVIVTVNVVLLVYTEIQTGSSTGGEIILGSVLGVLIFVAMAVMIAISVVLCLIKKGMHNDISPVHWMPQHHY